MTNSSGQQSSGPRSVGRRPALHTTLRALPRPLLESLTRAFRKRFQVPEEAATIADRVRSVTMTRLRPF